MNIYHIIIYFSLPDLWPKPKLYTSRFRDRERKQNRELPTVWSSKLRSKVTVCSQLEPANKLLTTCPSSLGDPRILAWQCTSYTFIFFLKCLNSSISIGSVQQNVMYNMNKTKGRQTFGDVRQCQVSLQRPRGEEFQYSWQWRSASQINSLSFGETVPLCFLEVRCVNHICTVSIKLETTAASLNYHRVKTGLL